MRFDLLDDKLSKSTLTSGNANLDYDSWIIINRVFQTDLFLIHFGYHIINE